MANLFFNLPAPAGDGVGAAVDTSGMGRERTFTVQGSYRGTVNVEISNDGGATWAQIASFLGGQTGKKVVEVAGQFTRVRRTGVPAIDPGVPNVDVGANDNGGLFTSLPTTVGDGLGAVVDTSALGTFNTVTVLGIFGGTVNVLISDDGVDFATCMTFRSPGVRSKEFSARFMRVERSGVPGVAPGTPVISVGAINDATSGAAGSAFGPIVYQPGGAGTGPGVVATWAEVLARISSIRTAQGGAVPIELQFDNSFGAIVFDAGTHDMENVTWTISPNVDLSVFFDVLVPEGVEFTNLRSFSAVESGARLESTAAATPPLSDFSDGEFIEARGWQFQASGGVPLIDLASLGAGDVVAISFEEGGGTGFGGTGPAISQPTAGSVLALRFGSSSTLQADTLSTGVGTIMFWQVQGDSNAAFPPQPSVAGTIVYQLNMRDRVSVNPVPPAAPAVAAIGFPLGENRYDASGGDIAQTLAPADSDSFPGQRQIFKVVSSIGSLTLTPAGADTIDEGRVTSVVVPPGGSAELVSNGIDNWDLVGIAGPAATVVTAVVVAAGTTAACGETVRVDPTGGAFALGLPAIGVSNSGCCIEVKNVSASTNAVTVTPAGADTVDGSATLLFSSVRGSVTLRSDGISDWMIV